MDAQDEEKIAPKEKTLSLKLQYLAPMAAFSWLVTLIVLLVAWAASNSPRYPSQNGLIPFISDIAAQKPKPLFIIACIITATTFFATIVIIHRHRTMFASPMVLEKVVSSPSDSDTSVVEADIDLAEKSRSSMRGLHVASWIAVVFTSIGLLSFVMLSGFDILLYPRMHSAFLIFFGVPLFIGLGGSVTLNALQAAAHPECAWLRKALWIKVLAATLLFIITIAFSVRMSTAERPFDYQFDQAAVLEWCLAAAADIYMLTYWYDLHHILRSQSQKSEPTKEEDA